jgi:predicted RNase H-related nuclease YkuK (DUF458 family)
MAMTALIIATLALLVAGVGVILIWTWRGDVDRIHDLAERLYAESRLEHLTTQTLGAMRDVARRHFRRDDLP